MIERMKIASIIRISLVILSVLVFSFSLYNPLPVFASTSSKIIFSRATRTDIEIINPDGTNHLRIGSGTEPRISPDGTKIVYIVPTDICNHTENHAIYVMNSDGSNSHNLTADLPCDSQAMSPSWSPDGTQIAYYYNRFGEVPGIYVMNADGSNKHLVIRAATTFISWSPGPKIAFNISQNIYYINGDGTGLTELNITGYYPEWSYDGTQIAFVDPNNQGIDVANADGSNEQQVYTPTQGTGVGVTVRWSPDSSMLAFSLFDPNTNHANLYTMPVTGGTLTEVYEGGNVNVGQGVDYIDWGQLQSPPYINPLVGAQIIAGQTYTENGTFVDPDDATSSSWTATVDYGDGSGQQPLSLSGMNFALNHEYDAVGTYTVTVSVANDMGLIGTTSTTVKVGSRTLNPIADSYLNYYAQNQNEGGSPALKIEQSIKGRTLLKFDESQIQLAVGNAPKFTATLVMTITDNGNNWGSGKQIELDRMFQDWSEGNGYINGNFGPDPGTGSGVTWKCASDSDISNNTKECTSANTWDMTNAANYPFSSSPTATALITNQETGIVNFDVTADIQSFLNGANQNFGWILKRTDESTTGKIIFGSKESGSGPVLIITPQ